jgi:signal transduction histidine kinase
MNKREKFDELITTNKETSLALATATKLIAFQYNKTGKQIAELIEANKKIALELIIANKELAIQNEEKEKRTAELVNANKELEQLVQLNSDKDLFISILAHDLKSPFTGLLGLSELLSENIHQYDINEIGNIVTLLKNLVENTNDLLEDLLKWARMQQGKIRFEPQKLNFTDIWKDIHNILNSNAIAKNITINHFTEHEINIFADIDMLKAILRNLVSNAIKFTNIGGAININAEEKSENAIISVSDNGIGIKPDYLPKLFDISQLQSIKGTEEEEGTGLGLVLCKEFVQKHGGKIWVESEYGKGSDFKFTMPIFTEQANAINN